MRLTHRLPFDNQPSWLYTHIYLLHIKHTCAVKRGRFAMPAPDEIARLVDRFARDEGRYSHPDYNEMEARTEFIDPFFAALGWDVANGQGVAPDLRDVLREQTFRR